MTYLQPKNFIIFYQNFINTFYKINVDNLFHFDIQRGIKSVKKRHFYNLFKIKKKEF